MITSNLRLALFCILLVITQFAINNFTVLYVDLFALVLISIVLRSNIAWPQLIILSLIADLVGHWFLGTHLLAITIVSLFSGKFVNFYRMCSWFQRLIISSMFFLLLTAIIYLVELITGRVFPLTISLLIEILLLLPLVELLLNKLVFKRSSEFIFHD